jgi:hypothetical protein
MNTILTRTARIAVATKAHDEPCWSVMSEVVFKWSNWAANSVLTISVTDKLLPVGIRRFGEKML